MIWILMASFWDVMAADWHTLRFWNRILPPLSETVKMEALRYTEPPVTPFHARLVAHSGTDKDHKFHGRFECLTPSTAELGSTWIHVARRLRADWHYTSRFRSVTVPSSFRQNGLCPHCPSCSVTFQNSTWQEAWDYLHQIYSLIRFIKDN